MPQPPKVISTTKRKTSTSESSVQELLTQITQCKDEMETLKKEKEKAMGSTEEEEKALSKIIGDYSATAKTNAAKREALRQAEHKAAAELQKLEQELAKATEKSKAAIVKRTDFEDVHAKQMNLRGHYGTIKKS